MNNNEYTTIGLYDHNADSYRKVKAAFDSGEKVVGIVHATGTGKSFNALQLAYDNKDKKILYVVPSNGIIEHIKEIIESNPNLDLERDFPNLEFITYQGITVMKDEEIKDLDSDILVLDEFHHIGAPVWGKKTDYLIKTHPNMNVFGMTAYTVRDRGTAYERDMINPDGDELFSNKVVSTYDLCDAMLDGVLPKPNYVTCYTHLSETAEELERRVNKLSKNSKDYEECSRILGDIKKQIHEAKGIADIMKEKIKPSGKYVYFCPPGAVKGVNDIETIKKEALEWFKQIAPEEDIVFYTTTSDMGVEGKKNMDAFYNDKNLEGEKVDGKLRVMFAINQYNEGIHAPNLDGVIMGRSTSSDIIFYEQLGRALSVRGDTKEKFDELMSKSYEELIQMCNQKGLHIENTDEKEDLVERLVAPIIIDLTNNIGFIEALEDNLKERIKLYQFSGLENHRDIKIKNASFFIEPVNKNIYDLFKYINDRITMNWEDKFELAKAYYEHHGNLEVQDKFRTINGYDKDENGFPLGEWIKTQRYTVDPSSEKGALLSSIGMRWDRIKNKYTWEEMYEFAKLYYEHHGDLEVPSRFRTSDGFTLDKNGDIYLGSWVANQRRYIDPSSEKGKRLSLIGMRFDNIRTPRSWEESYELAKAYYEYHGNLRIKHDFKTINGYEYDENGFRLGEWVSQQIIKLSPNSEKGKLLKEIGANFDDSYFEEVWKEKYELAKAYYEHHGNLNIPEKFKTTNGYEYVENGVNLYNWYTSASKGYSGYGSRSLTDEQITLMEKLGVKWLKKSDKKLQKEKIDDKNKNRKQIELRNRTITVLNKFDGDSLPSKDELNDAFMKQLNHNR